MPRYFCVRRVSSLFASCVWWLLLLAASRSSDDDSTTVNPSSEEKAALEDPGLLEQFSADEGSFESDEENQQPSSFIDTTQVPKTRGKEFYSQAKRHEKQPRHLHVIATGRKAPKSHQRRKKKQPNEVLPPARPNSDRESLEKRRNHREKSRRMGSASGKRKTGTDGNDAAKSRRTDENSDVHRTRSSSRQDEERRHDPNKVTKAVLSEENGELLDENAELKQQLLQLQETNAQKLLEAGAKNDCDINSELVERLTSLTKLQVFRFCKFLSGIEEAKKLCRVILVARFPEFRAIETKKEQASVLLLHFAHFCLRVSQNFSYLTSVLFCLRSILLRPTPKSLPRS